MAISKCRPLPALAALPVVTVLLLGCSGAKPDPDRLPVCPSMGQAVTAGKPAAGALLLFHPVAGLGLPALPRAVVGDDGRYTVGTYEAGDGLPEGEYVVTVYWTDKPPGTPETVRGKSLVNAVFTKKETSPLRATVAGGPDNCCKIPTLEITP